MSKGNTRGSHESKTDAERTDSCFQKLARSVLLSDSLRWLVCLPDERLIMARRVAPRCRVASDLEDNAANPRR